VAEWPSSRARRVLTALYRIGWQLKRETGSHKTLTREGWPDFVFAFHDGEQIGPRMLARIAKRTGLELTSDLWKRRLRRFLFDFACSSTSGVRRMH
jgi:predicted RNA binding protein YcfA (HicA-like mRNA interferase family)